MTALVPELVNAAIDATVSPGELLRRGLVVARRLAVPARVDWLSCELNGYYSGEAPDYRHLQGQLMVETLFAAQSLFLHHQKWLHCCQTSK